VLLKENATFLPLYACSNSGSDARLDMMMVALRIRLVVDEIIEG
jgi:hypothetical protein